MEYFPDRGFCCYFFHFSQWNVGPSWLRMNAILTFIFCLAYFLPVTAAHLLQQDQQSQQHHQPDDFAAFTSNSQYIDDNAIKRGASSQDVGDDESEGLHRLLTPVRTTAVYSKLYQWALQEVSPFSTFTKLKRTGGRGVLGFDNIDYAASLLDRARGRGFDLIPNSDTGSNRRHGVRGRHGPMSIGSSQSVSRSRPVPVIPNDDTVTDGSAGGQRRLSMNISFGDLKKLITMIKHGK